MIRIPELNQHSTPSVESRSTPRLNVPSALDRASSAESMQKNIKPLISGAKEIAGAYYDMKGRYDKAKAFQFLTSFVESSNEKLIGYEQNNRGLYAVGTTAEYREWSENEFAKAQISGGKDDAPLLENRDQIDIARKFLDRYNINNINKVSQFEARELMDYDNKQNTAMLSSLSAALSNESNPENIENGIMLISETLLESQPGQSPEYNRSQTMKVVSPVLRLNVEDRAIENPEGALASLSLPLFQKNMTSTDFEAARKASIKSFVANTGRRWGEELARGADFKFDPNILNEKIFDGYDREKLYNKIVETAAETKNNIERNVDKNHAQIQNAVVLYPGIITEEGIFFNNLTPEQKNSIFAGVGGAEFKEQISLVEKAKNEYFLLLSDGKQPEITEEALDIYGDVQAKLSAGQYYKFSDMMKEMKGMTYPMMVNVANTFKRQVYFDSQASQIKARTGLDMYKALESTYQQLSGIKDLSRSRMFPEFKDEMIQRLSARMDAGEKMDAQTIKETAGNYFSENSEDNSFRGRLTRVFQEVDEEIAKRKTKEPLSVSDVEDVAKGTLRNGLFGLGKSKAFDLDFSEENERRLVEAIASGNFEKAYGVLWSQQFAETQGLHQKEAEEKEKELERQVRKEEVEKAKKKAAKDPFAPVGIFDFWGE